MSDFIGFVVTVLFIFLAGVGVGTFVLGSRIRKVVAEVVAKAHQDYAAVEGKTKELIAAGVTRLEEIKKAL